MGISALGKSCGLDVKIFKDAPGPHRITAWRPGAGRLVACGIFQHVSYLSYTFEFIKGRRRSSLFNIAQSSTISKLVKNILVHTRCFDRGFSNGNTPYCRQGQSHNLQSTNTSAKAKRATQSKYSTLCKSMVYHRPHAFIRAL